MGFFLFYLYRFSRCGESGQARRTCAANGQLIPTGFLFVPHDDFYDKWLVWSRLAGKERRESMTDCVSIFTLVQTKENLTDEEMQKKMELQLHEQYAINNNSNLSSIIALFVAMLAVIGAYGYVYLHSSCIWDRTVMIGEDRLFTLKALVITAWAAIMTMFVMIYLCIELGMKQRFEQFITFAIRAKYYEMNKPRDEQSNNTNDDNDCVDKLIEKRFDESYSIIYPQGYHPFNKHCLEAVQGLYGSFVRILGITIMLIVVSLIPKCCYQCDICLSPNDCDVPFKWTVLLICGSSLIAFTLIKCRFDNLYEKYNNREKYYKQKIWNVKNQESENK